MDLSSIFDIAKIVNNPFGAITSHGKVQRDDEKKGKFFRRAKEPVQAPAVQKAPYQNLGNMTSQEFLAAMRSVGYRPMVVPVEVCDPITGEFTIESQPRMSVAGTPIMVFDHDAAKADERALIDSFVGYDRSLPHGIQLDSSRWFAEGEIRSAQRKLEGKKPEQWLVHEPERHYARSSMAGYVAGLPNARNALLQDLSARLKLSQKEVEFFDSLTAVYVNGDKVTYEAKIHQEYPEIQAVRPLTVYVPEKVAAGEKESFVEKIDGYERVTTRDPIGEKLLSCKDDSDTTCDLLDSLTRLAEARCNAIRNDIGGMMSEVPTMQQLERAHQSVAARGVDLSENIEKIKDGSVSTLVLLLGTAEAQALIFQFRKHDMG